MSDDTFLMQSPQLGKSIAPQSSTVGNDDENILNTSGEPPETMRRTGDKMNRVMAGYASNAARRGMHGRGRGLGNSSSRIRTHPSNKQLPRSPSGNVPVAPKAAPPPAPMTRPSVPNQDEGIPSPPKATPPPKPPSSSAPQPAQPSMDLSSKRPPSAAPPSKDPPTAAPPSRGPPSATPPLKGPPSAAPPSKGPPSTATPPPKGPQSAAPSSKGPPSAAPPSKGPPSAAPPSKGPQSAAPSSKSPPSAAPPSNGPPSAAPPSKGPPSAAPPSKGPPSAAPPSKGPSSAAPPSKGPPSAAPPFKGPPSATPPPKGPPTAAPPSKGQSTATPPPKGPPTAAPPSRGPSSAAPPSKGPPSAAPPSKGPPSATPPPKGPPTAAPPTPPNLMPPSAPVPSKPSTAAMPPRKAPPSAPSSSFSQASRNNPNQTTKLPPTSSSHKPSLPSRPSPPPGPSAAPPARAPPGPLKTPPARTNTASVRTAAAPPHRPPDASPPSTARTSPRSPSVNQASNAAPAPPQAPLPRAPGQPLKAAPYQDASAPMQHARSITPPNGPTPPKMAPPSVSHGTLSITQDNLSETRISTEQAKPTPPLTKISHTVAANTSGTILSSNSSSRLPGTTTAPVPTPPLPPGGAGIAPSTSTVSTTISASKREGGPPAQGLLNVKGVSGIFALGGMGDANEDDDDEWSESEETRPVRMTKPPAIKIEDATTDVKSSNEASSSTQAPGTPPAKIVPQARGRRLSLWQTKEDTHGSSSGDKESESNEQEANDSEYVPPAAPPRPTTSMSSTTDMDHDRAPTPDSSAMGQSTSSVITKDAEHEHVDDSKRKTPKSPRRADTSTTENSTTRPTSRSRLGRLAALASKRREKGLPAATFPDNVSISSQESSSSHERSKSASKKHRAGSRRKPVPVMLVPHRRNRIRETSGVTQPTSIRVLSPRKGFRFPEGKEANVSSSNMADVDTSSITGLNTSEALALEAASSPEIPSLTTSSTQEVSIRRIKSHPNITASHKPSQSFASAGVPATLHPEESITSPSIDAAMMNSSLGWTDRSTLIDAISLLNTERRELLSRLRDLDSKRASVVHEEAAWHTRMKSALRSLHHQARMMHDMHNDAIGRIEAILSVVKTSGTPQSNNKISRSPKSALSHRSSSPPSITHQSQSPSYRDVQRELQYRIPMSSFSTNKKKSFQPESSLYTMNGQATIDTESDDDAGNPLVVAMRAAAGTIPKYHQGHSPSSAHTQKKKYSVHKAKSSRGRSSSSGSNVGSSSSGTKQTTNQPQQSTHKLHTGQSPGYISRQKNRKSSKPTVVSIALEKLLVNNHKSPHGQKDRASALSAGLSSRGTGSQKRVEQARQRKTSSNGKTSQSGKPRRKKKSISNEEGSTTSSRKQQLVRFAANPAQTRSPGSFELPNSSTPYFDSYNSFAVEERNSMISPNGNYGSYSMDIGSPYNGSPEYSINRSQHSTSEHSTGIQTEISREKGHISRLEQELLRELALAGATKPRTTLPLDEQ